LPFCSRCGSEVKAGIKFCTNCGTPTGAPLPGAPPRAVFPPALSKPSHRKRNLAIIVIVVILVGILAAASRTPSQTATVVSSTIDEVPVGGTIAMGQSFMMQGTDDVPVQVNFTTAWFSMGGSYGYNGATPPNKLFVLQFQMQNVGIRTTTVFSSLAKWDVLVDKGYIYENQLNWNFTNDLDPTQVSTNDVVFSILSTTTPTQVRYYDTCVGSTADCSPTYIVDLSNIAISAKEELTFAYSNPFACLFQNTTANVLNVTDSGLIPVTISTIYYDGQSVSTTPTRILPRETVSIPITIPSNVQAGMMKQYEVKIVTTSGNTFTMNCYYAEGS
jgi:hypothetical protein